MLSNYGSLIRNLQIIYPQYKFQMVPITIGALGYIPSVWKFEMEPEKLVWKLQNVSISGTVKIYKTFLSFLYS